MEIPICSKDILQWEEHFNDLHSEFYKGSIQWDQGPFQYIIFRCLSSDTTAKNIFDKKNA